MPSDAPRPVLYLVDSSHHLYRAYFAIRRLATSQGVPTNAVYGFITMLKRLMEAHGPTHMACCFDRPEETFRHALYPDYKAQREVMPEDLQAQIEPVKRFCETMRVAVVEKAGFEADDLMGTLARAASEHGFDVVLVTNDKDLFQLVRPGIRVLLDKKDGEKFLDEAGVEETFGVKPSQVADVLALWGDPTDNIPGVPGIGEKGAKDIIRLCGSLEEAIRQSDALPQKRYRGKIAPHAERALLSRRLAAIRCDADVSWDAENFRVKGADDAALRAFYEEMEFRTLLAREEKPSEENRSQGSQEISSAKSARTEDLPIAAPGAEARLLDAASFALFLDSVHETKRVAVSLHPPEGGFSERPSDLVFAADERTACALPLEETGSAARAESILDDEQILKIVPDAKRLFLFYPGAREPVADPSLAAYVLDPEAGIYSVEALARRFLRREIGRPSKKAATLYEGNDLDVSVGSARAAIPLWKALSEELERHPLLKNLYDTMDLPLARVLAAMERRGVLVDTTRLKKFGDELALGIEALETDIYAMAGESFNIASPRQLGKILYEKLGLPVHKKTSVKRAASTGIESLEPLTAAHPIVPKLLDYRQKTKLKSTYVDALPRLIHPETGRLHTTYHQNGAATGRLSSSDPNLQNIPIRTAEGRKIREAFVAPEGWLLVSADYSQIELRLLAHLSGDEALLRAFERGEDVHARTAVEILGAPAGDVSAEARRAAKTINFGVIYGMSAFSLGKRLDISGKEAKSLMDAYFGRYVGVARFREEVLAAARKTGRVQTMFGRVRRIPRIADRNRTVREGAERAAFNTPLQGSAADLMKRAMLAVYAAFEKRDDVFLTMQVHDELVLEARAEKASDVARAVKRLMEDAFALRVPLVVDTKIGKTWAEEERSEAE